LTTSQRHRDSVASVRELRPRRLDLLPPALIALVGAVEIVAAGYQPRWLGLGTFLLASGVVSVGRLLPLAVPPVVAGIYAATPLLGFDVSQPASWVPLLALACFGTGLHAPRSRWPVGLACVLLALLVSTAGLAWFTDFEPGWLFGLIMSVGSWAIGLGLHGALDQNRSAAALAERARVESAAAAERAATRVRERIAAELNDVLAHSLAAMLVQSSAAGDLVRREPQAAARALLGIAQAGREALADTGTLLRSLRDEGDGLGQPWSTVTADIGGAECAAPIQEIRRSDVLLPALIGATATIELVSDAYRPLWLSIGIFWLAAVLLCARRRFPLAMPIGVFAIVVAAPLLGVDTENPASWVLAGWLACFSAGRYVPRSRSGLSLISVLTAIALLAVATAATGELSADVVFVLPFAVAPWAVGIALRETLERTRVLAARAERVRFERELEGERAVSAERRRIARELHDTLVGSLTVITIQASLAADLIVEDPAGATAAVSEAERAGRAAIADTGRLLRLIGDGDDQLQARPQPGLRDIPALAADYGRAGLGVDLNMDSIERLPAAVGLSSYYVVREALTNALKHAPGSSVYVRLTRTVAGVEVEVRNGPTASNGLATMPSGHGLTGLRERVAVIGGSLDAHPTGDGGFVLAATMPVPGSK
jgi:signal transduction histidine kinase